MKMLSTSALALALAFGGMIAAPAVAKEKEAKPAKAAAMQLSPKVRENAAAAQTALGKGDTESAKASLAAAEAEIKTPDDKLIVGQLYLGVAQKTQDQALLLRAANMVIDSGKAPAELLPQLSMLKARTSYNAKDFVAAEQAARAAQQAGSTDPDLIPVLVQSIQSQGRTLAALQLLNEQVDKAKAANQPVPEAWFQRGVAIGYGAKPGPEKAQIAALTSDLALKWVSSYPTKSNWRDAIVIYRDSSKVDADTDLDISRLLRTVGAMKGERDYMDYVLATYLRYPGEAQAVLNEGISSGQVNASGKNASEIKAIVTQKTPADKASLPASEKSARAASGGKVVLNTADAFLGYGEWAKAADLYKLALQKGGVDANVVNVRLGMALAKAGDAAGAKAAFAAVTGPRKSLADFWTAYLDHPPTA